MTSSISLPAEGEANYKHSCLRQPQGLSPPRRNEIERDTIRLFAEIGAAAAANDTGVVFLVDEMQLLAREDLEALCAAAHRANQDSLPVAVVGAGLPVLPERLTEVAARGGWRSGASAGPVRQTLIEKGLIYSPDRGLVAFTVPHFADFARRKHPIGSPASRDDDR